MTKNKPAIKTMTTILNRLYDLEVSIGVSHIDRMTMGMQLIQMERMIDLDKLLAFDDLNFIHDMAGINAHTPFNAEEFSDCFSPRSSK